MKVVFYDGAVAIDPQELWGLHFNLPVMSMPAVKTNYISIPGRSGDLDATEIDGNVYYEDAVFDLLGEKLMRTTAQAREVSADVVDRLHGRRLQVRFDEEAWYYDARISVLTYSRGSLKLGVSIECRAQPYMLAVSESEATAEIAGTGELTLQNARMPVVPTIDATAEMKLQWGGYTATIAAGEDIVLPDLVLREGETKIAVTGTGTITFRYRQGKLVA